jgi:hypothetical protein
VSDVDLILGGLLQVMGLFAIFATTTLKNKVTYKPDLIDVFLIVTLLMLIITSFFSINSNDAYLYSAKYLLIGIPFFIVSKILFINTDHFENVLIKMLYFIVDLALVFGLIAGSVVIISGYEEPYAAYGVIMRLTIQGVHPIPFAQTIGLGLLSGVFLIQKNIKAKKQKNILIIKSLILAIVLLYTNTRGVIVSLALASLIGATFYLERPKISKKSIWVLITSLVVMITCIILYIDINSIFGRFYSDELAFQSILLRFDSVFESLKIFNNNFFTGIGPTAFPYYSELPYPHNFFLEYLVFFGVWGLVAAIFFIIIIAELFIITNKRKNKPFYTFLFVVFLFFFIETQVSYTLWTHKGLYFSLGLLTAFYTIKSRSKESLK